MHDTIWLAVDEDTDTALVVRWDGEGPWWSPLENVWVGDVAFVIQDFSGCHDSDFSEMVDGERLSEEEREQLQVMVVSEHEFGPPEWVNLAGWSLQFRGPWLTAVCDDD